MTTSKDFTDADCGKIPDQETFGWEDSNALERWKLGGIVDHEFYRLTNRRVYLLKQTALGIMDQLESLELGRVDHVEMNWYLWARLIGCRIGSIRITSETKSVLWRYVRDVPNVYKLVSSYVHEEQRKSGNADSA